MDVNIVILESFKKWLQTLGYAESTVYASTNYVRDFFFYLKRNDITQLEQIQTETIVNYHKYLQTRSNRKQTGGLSQNYINNNINALKRFSRYLQETEKPFFEVTVKSKMETCAAKTILTQQEIKAMYKACENNYLGVRDRAILGIFYGCGLRRSEGINLNVSDVLLKEKLVYVRKGKNYKERYVPISETVKSDLELYIKTAREKILSFKTTDSETWLKHREAFFLSYRTKRMHGNSLIKRLHQLKIKAGINKETGLHTLRHSIATHLLQSGMELEEVSQFLGHSSLESTQVYTHIAYE